MRGVKAVLVRNRSNASVVTMNARRYRCTVQLHDLCDFAEIRALAADEFDTVGIDLVEQQNGADTARSVFSLLASAIGLVLQVRDHGRATSPSSRIRLSAPSALLDFELHPVIRVAKLAGGIFDVDELAHAGVLAQQRNLANGARKAIKHLLNVLALHRQDQIRRADIGFR